MDGSPKQVAWAEKIIAYKTKGAKTSGIDEKDWKTVVDTITEKYGAKGWIDMRDVSPRQLANMVVSRVAKPAEPIKPAKTALIKSTEQMAVEAVKQGINPEVAAKAAELQKRIEAAPLDEQRSIRTFVTPHLQNAGLAAKRGNNELALKLLAQADTELARIVPVAIPAAPEPNWANMSAKEIATKYADDMAQIIISAGGHVTAGMFADAGAEFAADAAAERASAILQARATEWTKNHADDIAETLSKAAKSSESAYKVAEELGKKNVAHAETVARTELATARELANIEIMDAQGVQKVQFVAAEDERLCEVCASYHGKIYDINDAPVLPLHPNCRCTLVPYIDNDGGDT